MLPEVKYHSQAERQVHRVKRFARNAITTIWVAGLMAVLLLALYFNFLPGKDREKIQKSKTAYNHLLPVSGDELFTNKTTLVNAGLRIQAISGDAELPPGGTISINKIIHDRKLNKVKKNIPTDFAIKAVPK